MRFALLSADPTHGKRFWINPEEGDATSFMNWVNVWKGYHFNFDETMKDISFLKDYDVVMMSGHPGHLAHIRQISDYLRPTDTVTMFYPEGSTQLYGESINHFHRETYDAWNACDVVSSAEEDKESYYQAFLRSRTVVRFIHVPMREEMEAGYFFIPLIHKHRRMSLVYGDNNPNHPLIAIACSARMGMEVLGIEIDRGKLQEIKDMFPGTTFYSSSKVGQYPFLRALGRCLLQFYPTGWIGTARQQISCAVAGTPCIGNHDSHTQRRLFPELGADIYDVDRMCSLANMLRSDPEFYEHVTRQAFKASKFYGLEPTKARFLEAVDAARAAKRSAQEVIA